MKRPSFGAALLGLALGLPALAKEPAQARGQQVSRAGDEQPVALTDEQLDAVSGGDLISNLLNITSLNIGNVTSVLGSVQGVLFNLDQIRDALNGAPLQAVQVNVGNGQ